MPEKLTKDYICIALDTQSLEEVNNIINDVKDYVGWVKVGLELFVTMGPKIIKTVKNSGMKVFIDLKLHDIPNTVKNTCYSLTKLGVDMINVHASGGPEMIAAAVAGITQSCRDNNISPIPKLAAVTVLTSLDIDDMEHMFLTNIESMTLLVTRLADIAILSGVDAIICSPLEAKDIKNIKRNILVITPGIRPATADANDQKRVMTPTLAIQNGANIIVVGRAITAAHDRRKAAEDIFNEVQAVDIPW
jgi:orotidine-5'-phosphate decarboxylase